jgi:hypothetical protein
MMTLPYSFAKRHQILVVLAIDPELPPTLVLTKATPLSAINEAVRFLQQQGVRGMPIYDSTSSDDFEKRMNAAYAGNTGESLHIAAGLEDHPDHDSLVDSVPEDDALRRMIHSNTAEYELEEYARQTTPSIRADGLRKVIARCTTLEEVLRVTKESALTDDALIV